MAKNASKKAAPVTLAQVASIGHNSEAVTKEQLLLAAEAGWKAASADLAQGAIVELIKQAGSQTAVKNDFWASYMARRMNPKAIKATANMIADARRILSYSNADAEKAKVGRRTKEQDAFFAAARKAWSRLIKAAGFGADDNRGGANNAGTEASKAKAAATRAEKAAPVTVAEHVRAKAEALPKAAGEQDVLSFVEHEADKLYRFMNENFANVPDALKDLVRDFRTNVKALANPIVAAPKKGKAA